ncbi:hypothetical protein CPB84DRAFT_1963975 [Gymnopilus junonius]|uniref:Uncharacterized protein n=1 Tax=Gymnopilus junonius TaxID=109634 RepID=A0A9P5TJV4_GYMJU|nr:hypothetical protein CPB84DRAFT_1963975 [Gymnopilus junonius]
MAPQGPPQPNYSPQLSNNRTNITMDFTKGIAAEVRILLAEIGKLRDERRQLQYEIAELMAVRSKFSPNGEFQPEWRPPPPAIEAPPPELPPQIEEGPPPAKPGWRVVHKRPDRKARTVPKITGHPAPAPAPPPALPEPPKPEAPAWAQWRPNPLLTTSASSPGPNSPPPRTGLFGPATPPPK